MRRESAGFPHFSLPFSSALLLNENFRLPPEVFVALFAFILYSIQDKHILNFLSLMKGEKR